MVKVRLINKLGKDRFLLQGFMSLILVFITRFYMSYIFFIGLKIFMKLKGVEKKIERQE